MDRVTLIVIGLLLIAIANTVLGYCWFYRQAQITAEFVCYGIAFVAACLAIRTWGRRNYYP